MAITISIVLVMWFKSVTANVIYDYKTIVIIKKNYFVIRLTKAIALNTL